MRKPIIEFDHVSKRYGDQPVLDDISIQIEPGEFVTLIGRSGCGKTTFLKMINALLLPDSGHVYVSGKDIRQTDQIALRRSIGYVIQNVGLFPHMSVRRNVEYVPHLFRRKPAQTVAPERLMEIVSLEPEYLDRYPNQLSGGQKQRVGIARALAIMPSILLMDEPFGAVDEITRRQLQDSLCQIQSQLGITIVFVTHSIDEALRLGTKTAIFGEHKILQFDTPENILKNPATPFVQALTGEYPKKL